MKRYIDVDKALNALEILKTDGKTDIPISGIEIYLNRTAITEADLMIVSETCPVTRCKDCVYYDGDNCFYISGYLIDDNGFCSFGRKENERAKI